MTVHIPVLLSESVRALNIKPDSFFIDGTFGRGGHTRAILAQLGPTGRVLAMDKDPEAIATAKILASEDPRLLYWHGSFTEIPICLQQFELPQPDGILLDLGVSSPQLDNSVRGFSFMQDGPLDMRMDPTRGQSAAEFLNTADAEEIARVLYVYGEERASRRIAAAIVAVRQHAPLSRTHELARIVAAVVPGKPGRHPATQTFQAIRIWINQELADLEKVLDVALTVLKPAGRLCVISFHSLEDRCVKQFFAAQAGGNVPKDLPLRDWEIPRAVRLIDRAIKATAAEITMNPRSRSARLRIAEKLESACDPS